MALDPMSSKDFESYEAFFEALITRHHLRDEDYVCLNYQHESWCDDCYEAGGVCGGVEHISMLIGRDDLGSIPNCGCKGVFELWGVIRPLEYRNQTPLKA